MFVFHRTVSSGGKYIGYGLKIEAGIERTSTVDISSTYSREYAVFT